MIKIVDIWKRFNSLEVLKGLNLNIEQGEILVILGRSGVGKSVLLKHIIGIEKPDKGYVEVDGINITALNEHDLYAVVQNMGMLFQGCALFDSLNVESNTAFYLSQHVDPVSKKKLSENEIKERVREALKMVDLEGTEKKMPSDLSGGMKKRAALARLIAYRPKILLYDEPTTGLDPMTATQINELIIRIQNELKGTSIVVTHDIHSALFIADRLALQEGGIITELAPAEKFLSIDNPIVSFLKENLEHHPLKRREEHG
ncbi:MAG: ATP-binding cassette domain-containing protein [Parachlamydiales bacterium]|jgi:phospholipid/cholesterol/gamma-HCH transport system ATP-binding protein